MSRIGTGTVLADPSGAEAQGAPVRLVPARWNKLVWAGAAVLASLLGIVFGVPVLALGGLCLSCSLPMRRLFAPDLALQAATAICVAALALIGLIAGTIEVDLLSAPVWSGAAILAVALLLAVVGCRLSWIAANANYRWAWVRVLLWAPAAVLMLVGLADAVSTWRSTGWGLLGTDLMAHVVALRGVQEAGNISLDSIGGYPQGMQWALAVAGNLRAPADAHELAAYDLRAMAGSTWAAMALAALGGSSFAVRMAMRLGWSPSKSAVAGLVAGSYLAFGLGPHSWLVLMGAAPSALLVAFLWLPGLVAMDQHGSGPGRNGVVLVVGATIVVAGAALVLWPILVPVPVIGFGVYLIANWSVFANNSGHRRGKALAAAVIVVLGAGTWLLVVPWLGPSLSETLSIGGPVGGPQRVTTILGIVGLAIAAWTKRRDPWMQLVLATGLALGCAAVAVSLVAGEGEFYWGYYPLKVLRFASYFLVPFYAVALTWAGCALVLPVWRWVGRCRPSVQVVLAACAVFILGTVALPWAMAFPPTSLITMSLANAEATGISRRHWDLGMRYATEFAPAVTVPMLTTQGSIKDLHSDRIVSLVIQFVSGAPSVVGLEPGQRCKSIKALGRDAHIITSEDPRAVSESLARAGCPGLEVTAAEPPTR